MDLTLNYFFFFCKNPLIQVKSGLKKPESLEEAKELDTEAKTFLVTLFLFTEVYYKAGKFI